MNKLSRSEQMLAEKTVCVLLVRGESPEGTPIFAYLAVRADKLEDFMEAQKTGVFFPEDYGIIIESGEHEPSEEVKQRMESEYGFNHGMMVDIPDAGEAASLAHSIVAKPQGDSAPSGAAE